MKQITLGLPPEIIDALQHSGGRDEAEMRRIICDALRTHFQRRKRPTRRPAPEPAKAA